MKHAIAGTLAISILLAGCGRDEASAPAETPAAQDTAPVSEAPPEPAPPVAAEPVPPSDAPLAVGDLDHYVAGMTKEIELLKGHADALAKARAAKDQTAELAALMHLGGVEVRNAGAAAAGIDVSRYETIKQKIDEVLSAAEMGAAMKPQIEAAEQADVSGFTEEQRKQHADGVAELKKMWAAPHDKLPAEVVDPFKAREAELAKLRSEALALRLSAL